MTSNTTTETTQTTRSSTRQPAQLAGQSIEIRLTNNFRDAETFAPERFEVDRSLVVPMPDVSPQIHFAYERPKTDPTIFRTSMLVEDFFSGIGLELPSRKKAREMVEVVQKAKAETAELTQRFGDTTTRLENQIAATNDQRLAWRRYAEALEARIERGGGRIGTKMFATRPEPRG